MKETRTLHPNTKSRLLRALSTRPGETAAKWLRRIECEIAFALAFPPLLPAAQTAEWPALIEKAQALLDNFDASGGLFGLSGAVREAENLLAPIGQAAKKYTVHCVGHGHIDMNWMWSWPETVAATHDTFASVLSLMEQYPDLTFTQSQVSVYALVERYYPEMFEAIKARVQEGRWEIAAAHWVEGDKNISSGESIARHLLYSRAYLAEKFDLLPEDVPVDWEPDTFGHANTIPTILAQGGVKFYYSCRQGGGFDHTVIGDAPRPRLFWWQGPDGSRVLVNRESTWYNSYVNIGDNIALPAVGFYEETGLTDWLNIYGIGNHGGGPTRTEIDYYHEMQEWPIYPQIIFSTTKRWFETVEAVLTARGEMAPIPSDTRKRVSPPLPPLMGEGVVSLSEPGKGANGFVMLPVLDHELNFEFTGCYTSQSLIKQANRFGENYLVEAETLASLTTRLYRKGYPAGQLREGWINVLFNQFHDILPGSGVRQTREHALGLFQEVGAITGSIKRIAGKALAAGIDTLSLLPDSPEADEEKTLHEAGQANAPFEAGAGIRAMESGYSIASGGGRRFKPFVVYNPCAWTRSEPVTVALYDTDLDPARLVARDETGTQHPTLFLGRGADWGHQKINVLFLARDIPPLGYRTYLLCEGVADAETPSVAVAPGEVFETPFLHLKYDRYGSGFTEVMDKRNDARLSWPNDWGTIRPLGSWEFVNERPRGMTSWVLGGEVDLPLTLRSSSYAVLGAARNGGTGTYTANGIALRVDQTLEVPFTQSTVRLSTLVHGLEPRIDVTAEVDWREIGDPKRGIPGLSVRFPVDIDERSDLVRYETPFGSVTRDLNNGEEVPTLRYAHLIGEGTTDDYDKSPLAGFTLLQDSKYGHAVQGSDLRLRIIRSSFDPDHAPEVCRQTIRYSMYFHNEEPTPADLTRLGAGWNHPFIVFPADMQTGDGGLTPPSRSFANVETPGVVLSALKQAEDGNGLVLRLVELNGKDTEAIVILDPALTSGLRHAELLDLMERPVAGGAAKFDGKTLTVAVKANSFVTVRLA